MSSLLEGSRCKKWAVEFSVGWSFVHLFVLLLECPVFADHLLATSADNIHKSNNPWKPRGSPPYLRKHAFTEWFGFGWVGEAGVWGWRRAAPAPPSPALTCLRNSKSACEASGCIARWFANFLAAQAYGVHIWKLASIPACHFFSPEPKPMRLPNGGSGNDGNMSEMQTAQ